MTFKENCPDIRNSKVIDVINELHEFGCIVDVCDPLADPFEVVEEYGVKLVDYKQCSQVDYDAIILAVAHEKFKNYDFSKFFTNQTVIYDIKGFFDRDKVNGRL